MKYSSDDFPISEIVYSLKPPTAEGCYCDKFPIKPHHHLDTSKYHSYEEWRNDSVVIRPDIPESKEDVSGGN